MRLADVKEKDSGVVYFQYYKTNIVLLSSIMTAEIVQHVRQRPINGQSSIKKYRHIGFTRPMPDESAAGMPDLPT